MMRSRLALLAAFASPVLAVAQASRPDAPPSPPPPASPAASAVAPEVQRVEVTGGRPTDVQERRQSTAAKIIVGREEIEQYGDASLGELLKRLPGVTVSGNAGRGGNIRMRGLGGGYTQILLDGERVQGGLSLDAIDPEMVERIEILRAPTAETGARAVAGTINIITREGFRKRLNDLKLNAGLENGIVTPSLNWTRDDKWDDVTTHLSLNLWSWRRRDEGETTTTTVENGQTFVQREGSRDEAHRAGINANARLQWPLGEGQSFTLMPFLSFNQGGSDRRQALVTTGTPPDGLTLYDLAEGDHAGRFMLARLNANWRARLGEGRFEGRGGVGASQSTNESVRREFDADGYLLRTVDDTSDSRERNAHLNAKYSLLLENGHSLVSGVELDLARRTEARTTLEDGEPQLSEFGGNLRAATQRVAVYAQDEWSLSSQWAAHAGLRWEGITTEGEGADAVTERNTSSVWTPLLHAVWKPEPKSRDQVRLSLTRSYRSPTLQNLLARPALSTRYPTDGTNTPTHPDRAGNPALAPELATGLDIALERYLPGGGLLSANVFHRRISDLMRTLTTLEDVPWSDEPRWVARPQNVGEATTQGVELEARFKLSELLDDAPGVDLRANVSVFRSTVDSVPGPDNRLEQQPGGTANLGADYRWPGLPITVGGNVNLTPGYRTRLSEAQWIVQAPKRVLDAYALWTLRPDMRLRLSASNLLAQDAESRGATRAEDYAETSTSLSPTYLSWRVSLELKL
ncbi:TonB-dependent receptor plug domain-containing protein [Ideonella sp.]|uniref:TonB-dependent receptor plug domain-containing protein n=1 Tax=Ideonella sp. TaxID=1929293 RepID=UPI0035B45EB6